jgi:hypothetical protein
MCRLSKPSATVHMKRLPPRKPGTAGPITYANWMAKFWEIFCAEGSLARHVDESSQDLDLVPAPTHSADGDVVMLAAVPPWIACRCNIGGRSLSGHIKLINRQQFLDAVAIGRGWHVWWTGFGAEPVLNGHY